MEAVEDPENSTPIDHINIDDKGSGAGGDPPPTNRPGAEPSLTPIYFEKSPEKCSAHPPTHCHRPPAAPPVTMVTVGDVNGSRPVTMTSGTNLIMVNGQLRKIPRPRNAFMIFANEFRRQFFQKFPRESNSNISVRLGRAWRELDADTKEKYYRLSREEERRHKEKYPFYHYIPAISKKLSKRKATPIPKMPSDYIPTGSNMSPVSVHKVTPSNYMPFVARPVKLPFKITDEIKVLTPHQAQTMLARTPLSNISATKSATPASTSTPPETGPYIIAPTPAQSSAPRATEEVARGGLGNNPEEILISPEQPPSTHSVDTGPSISIIGEQASERQSAISQQQQQQQQQAQMNAWSNNPMMTRPFCPSFYHHGPGNAPQRCGSSMPPWSLPPNPWHWSQCYRPLTSTRPVSHQTHDYTPGQESAALPTQYWQAHDMQHYHTTLASQHHAAQLELQIKPETSTEDTSAHISSAIHTLSRPENEESSTAGCAETAIAQAPNKETAEAWSTHQAAAVSANNAGNGAAAREYRQARMYIPDPHAAPMPCHAMVSTHEQGAEYPYLRKVLASEDSKPYVYGLPYDVMQGMQSPDGTVVDHLNPQDNSARYSGYPSGNALSYTQTHPTPSQQGADSEAYTTG